MVLLSVLLGAIALSFGVAHIARRHLAIMSLTRMLEDSRARIAAAVETRPDREVALAILAKIDPALASIRREHRRLLPGVSRAFTLAREAVHPYMDAALVSSGWVSQLKEEIARLREGMETSLYHEFCLDRCRKRAAEAEALVLEAERLLAPERGLDDYRSAHELLRQARESLGEAHQIIKLDQEGN